MNQRIVLVKDLDNPSIFVVPTEYDNEGVSIKQVFMDGNFVVATDHLPRAALKLLVVLLCFFKNNVVATDHLPRAAYN